MTFMDNVWETYGASTPDAQALMRRLAREIEFHESAFYISAAAVFNHISSAMAVSLQKGNYVAINSFHAQHQHHMVRQLTSTTPVFSGFPV
jgi:uncharacterized membrane protein YjjP (DUF1212 family)